VSVSDRGAGAVVVLGLVAMTLLIAALLVPAVWFGPARHLAAAAADAAALAAADTLSGRHEGHPCERAARVVAAHGAELGACVPEGLVVSVEAVVGRAFLTVAAVATAGPPP